ncbi:MAG: Gfo/Idh/MocA family oxidoreductase [Oscillospiraceae bacterium]|nr:Gfo/Idh/MocA family oxidoreductase [Oscillospiraceae bacterium]
MRYALIGCGRVANSHITAARNNHLNIAALCDIDPKPHLQLDDVPRFADYRDMLSALCPELVAIATPSGLHAQMALDCLDAGAHVIIEKPMAMNLADAAKIAEKAKETGLVVGVNLQNRFNPAAQQLKAAVDAGRFGRIFSASMQLQWHRDDGYYTSAAWRGTHAQDGGAMMNQSIHGIDLLNWMMGADPVQVKAFRSTLARNIEAEDLAAVALQYPGGALASLQCTTLRYHGAQEQILELNGERGFVRLGGSCAQVIDIWRFDDNAPDEEARMRRDFGTSPTSVYGHGHSLHYADVLRAIATGTQPLVNADEGMRALKIILAAYANAPVGEVRYSI